MVKVKLSGQSYSIPIAWNEVKFIDFANSRNKPLNERLSLYTGIPQAVIESLDLETIKKLIDLVSFQDSQPEFFEPVSIDIEVGNEAYIKLEQSRDAMAKGNEWQAAIEITKLYLKKDISQMSVFEGMGYAVFFLKALKNFSSVTKH